MILRRFKTHVENENWFAVALDFVIVVAGILIAFQITNWSEAQQDRAREGQIIDRLLDDFKVLKIETDEKIEFLESIADTVTEAQSLIVNYSEGADPQLLQRFYETAFNLPATTDQSDTYGQLVSNGDMSLIRNDQLRDQLVAHASLTRQFISSDKARREFTRPYITPMVRLGMLSTVLPLDEAFSESGSKSDLVVAASMYQNIFENQLSMFKMHRDSFADLVTALEAAENQ